MKKMISLSLLSFLLVISAKAQDLIVTKEGDSINCQIKQITKDYIHFAFRNKNSVKTTIIPVKQVQDFKYKYFEVSEISADKINPEQIYPLWKFGFTAGYAYRTAKSPSNSSSSYEDYVDKLRSGFAVNMELHRYIRETFGFGVQYSYSGSKESANNIDINGFGVSDIEENVSVNFIGPSFSLRSFNLTRKNCFFMNIAIGYMGYKDNATLGNTDIMIKGQTAGLKYDIGYDIGLSKSTSLGFQVSYLAGTLTRIEVTDNYGTQTVELEKEEYENLGRLDISAGIKITW